MTLVSLSYSLRRYAAIFFLEGAVDNAGAASIINSSLLKVLRAVGAEKRLAFTVNASLPDS